MYAFIYLFVEKFNQNIIVSYIDFGFKLRVLWLIKVNILIYNPKVFFIFCFTFLFFYKLEKLIVFPLTKKRATLYIWLRFEYVGNVADRPEL